MVTAVARKLAMTADEFEVVMAGSVFKGQSPVLIDAMRTVVQRECPLALPVMPVFEPVVGALLMGMERDLRITDTIYTTLSQSLDTAESNYSVKFKME